MSSPTLLPTARRCAALSLALIALLSAVGCGKFSPTECPANGRVTVSKQKFTGTGTLIEAGLNCEVVIEDSTLKGTVVVHGGLNTRITIVNSVIEGTDTALDLGTNAHVEISEASEVKGKVAIRGGTNANVTVEASKILGVETGFAAGDNTSLELKKGSELTGKTAAYDGAPNSKVTVDASRVHSAGVALRGTNLLELHGVHAKVEGGRAGVLSEMNTKVDLRDDSKLTADGAAVDSNVNLDVSLDHSSIEGNIGVKAGGNATVKLAASSTVHGKELGVRGTNSLNLRMDGSTVRAKGAAVKGEGNGRIEARGSTIEGAPALQFDRKPILDLTTTKVNGAQTFGDAPAAGAESPAASATAAAGHKHKHHK